MIGRLVVAAILLGSANVALAEQQDTLADALFRSARAEMKAGDYAEACPKLDESYRLDPAKGTLLNKAVCEEGLGLSATAWTDYMRFVEAVSPDDDRVELAQARIRELEPHLPRLRIVIRGKVPGAVFHLDGIELRPASIGIEMPVDPGEHRASVLMPDGRQAERTVRVDPDQHVEIELEVAPAQARPATMPTPSTTVPVPLTQRSTKSSPPRPARLKARSSGLLIAGYSVAGVGVASLVTAGVLTAIALDERSVVARHCMNRVCDHEGIAAAQDGVALLDAADVTLAIGAAGAAVGGFLLFKAWTTKPTITASAHGMVASLKGTW